jgi:bifunctional NMN adenylyltransferase/nudix hydrolase
MKQYKLAVVIGRMQFLHNGHTHLFREAAKKADQLLVLVGSADKAPSPSNPFNYRDREAVILGALGDMFKDSEHLYGVKPLADDYREEQWQLNVMNAVMAYCEDQLPETGLNITDADIVLVGHEKDDSSYYLKSFPQWAFYNAPNDRGLNATDFRKELFDQDAVKDYTFLPRLYTILQGLDPKDGAVLSEMIQNFVENSYGLIQHFQVDGKYTRILRLMPDMTHLKLNSPASMHAFLEDYVKSERYFEMRAESQRYRDDKFAWSMAPYPVTFVTTDAVVTHKSSILMIRRKFNPGKGLWALPGGFLGEKQWIRDSIIRELREETRIAVANDDLLRIMQPIQVFDNPGRSLRGRTITHAARFNLDHLGLEKRPKVRADDDAEAVRWFTFGEILKADSELFEDHAEIIKRLVFSRG